MKTKPLYQILPLFFILGILLLSSCKNSSSDTLGDDNDTIPNNKDSIDLIKNNNIAGDSDGDTMTVKKVFKDPDTQEAHQEIVKKYGEQWDLCHCIQKSDSVNKALMEASDGEFDAVMERSDYIDKKCKDMLIHPNETPEERYAYQKKVNDCLKKSKK